MQAPLAVTIPDAVKATGLSRSALYEALKRGDLIARKAGRRTLISFTDPPSLCHDGSTVTAASAPSPIRQKIANRLNSLYDGTCPYSQVRLGSIGSW